MNHHKNTVYVMMSGGVDSSVAAATLKEQGYHVHGVFMKCWSLEALQNLGVSSDLYGCFWEDDVQDAELVAKKLGIPFEVWDFQDVYSRKVVEYMLAEYKRGQTPNPDVMCNSVIKFGVFYEKAIALGADFVATGHYARLVHEKVSIEGLGFENTVPLIGRGFDSNKDQSYFLWGIPHNHLDHVLFPIGEFSSKKEVRETAEKLDLITARKPDSQGLCFVGQTPLRELLLQTLGSKPGNIITEDGKVLGVHQGAYLYTIGQREKLGLSGGPWFVVEIRIDSNEVIVAHQSNQQQLFRQSLVAGFPNWQIESFASLSEGVQFVCQAQTRYRQEPEHCTITIGPDSTLDVAFQKPVRAIARGQSIVFYNQDVMLGGAVIIQ